MLAPGKIPLTRTVRVLPELFFTPYGGDFGRNGDIEKRLLHKPERHVVQFAVARTDAVSENHHVVAEIARAPSSAFDAAFGGDAANDDRLEAFAAQHEIEVGADESIGPPLMEDAVLRLRCEDIDHHAVVGICFPIQERNGSPPSVYFIKS